MVGGGGCSGCYTYSSVQNGKIVQWEISVREGGDCNEIKKYIFLGE